MRRSGRRPRSVGWRRRSRVCSTGHGSDALVGRHHGRSLCAVGHHHREAG